jgi:hypothetical protein
MKRASLAAFQSFRKDKIHLLEEKKISPEEFTDSIFGFILKSHVKPTTKAQNKNQVLLNYYYWLTYAERKVTMEEHLIEMGLGTQAQLYQSVQTYMKRRDKMVIRLILELKEKPASIIKISKNQYEVVLGSGEVLYAGDELSTELKLDIKNISKSQHPAYSAKFILPF